MGNIFAKLFGSAKPLRILMLGLDNAGKTSILYRMADGRRVDTVPTLGFNVETVHQSKCLLRQEQTLFRALFTHAKALLSITYKKSKMVVWDVGGQDQLRPLWRHYYNGTDCLIFVVDSADYERLPEAKRELHKILNERGMVSAKVLIFANKVDLPRGKQAIVTYDKKRIVATALTQAQLADNIGSLRGHQYYIQQSCALTGEGLIEGFEWIRAVAQNK